MTQQIANKQEVDLAVDDNHTLNSQQGAYAYNFQSLLVLTKCWQRSCDLSDGLLSVVSRYILYEVYW